MSHDVRCFHQLCLALFRALPQLRRGCRLFPGEVGFVFFEDTRPRLHMAIAVGVT